MSKKQHRPSIENVVVNRGEVLKVFFSLRNKTAPQRFTLIDRESWISEHLYTWKNGSTLRVVPRDCVWSSDRNGYALTSTYHFGPVRWIKLHRLIAEVPGHLDTDHINGDKLDNRRDNLRHLTTKQNARAMAKIRSKTGYRNVRRHGKGYTIRCWNGLVERSQSGFATAEQAARAWDSWAIQNGYLEEALNFPEEMDS